MIIDLDATAGTALTVQYTGFGPTRELEAFYLWKTARNLNDFRRGLDRFDVGSQNWAYADRWGNLGYFTSAEMPIRTDLEAGAPALGIPPYFIRVGSLAAHQWLPQQNSYPGQTIRSKFSRRRRCPGRQSAERLFRQRQQRSRRHHAGQQPLEPATAHGGIFYLNPAMPRASGLAHHRKSAAGPVHRDQKLSVEEMADIQADVGLLDAEYSPRGSRTRTTRGTRQEPIPRWRTRLRIRVAAPLPR